ncbi:hypothetical protein BKA93DRAFT_749331 [Sparassis latifolia]
MHTHAHKGKGKARADVDGEFRVVQASLAVSVPPVFASNLARGVEELLDSMLMRYIPALHGVVLAHDSLRFLDRTATIKADCPFANCRVGFDATVWSPRVGMKLVGKVNLCSPDHVSLLIHRTFNASIPRHHISTDEWEFEYGPAENDPEFGPQVAAENDADGTPKKGADDEKAAGVDRGGRWVHKITGAKLGGENGSLEFTVVGLTVANQMLSLVGSIQPDPFSPEHVPVHTAAASESREKAAPSNIADEPEPLAVDGDSPDIAMDGEDEEEEDTFEMLGRLADEAAAQEKEQRAKEEEAARKEKRRKRKEAKSVQGQDGAASDVPEAKKAKKKKKS